MISRLRTNSVEFATIIRCTAQVSQSSGTGPNAMSFFLNYPSYYVNAAGAIAQMGSVPSILAEEQKTFDMYKVVQLKTTYYPWVTGQQRVSTAVAFTAPNDPTALFALDYDDSALFTSQAKALNAQNLRAVIHSYDGRTHSVLQRQVDPTLRERWLNLGAIAPSLTSPGDPNQTAPLACTKFWKASYLLTATQEASIICEWMVLFKSVYVLA